MGCFWARTGTADGDRPAGGDRQAGKGMDGDRQDGKGMAATGGKDLPCLAELLTKLCAVGGLATESARKVAVTVIAATEGAVALCRAERSIEPFEDVAAVLLSLVQATPN
jgi:hypothetical protein